MGEALFELGQVLATPAALEALKEAGTQPQALLALHSAGLWGDLDEHDRRANEAAITDGSRILSAYEVGGARFYIITEATNDEGRREATTIMLASEY